MRRPPCSREKTPATSIPRFAQSRARARLCACERGACFGMQRRGRAVHSQTTCVYKKYCTDMHGSNSARLICSRGCTGTFDVHELPVLYSTYIDAACPSRPATSRRALPCLADPSSPSRRSKREMAPPTMPPPPPSPMAAAATTAGAAVPPPAAANASATPTGTAVTSAATAAATARRPPRLIAIHAGAGRHGVKEGTSPAAFSFTHRPARAGVASPQWGAAGFVRPAPAAAAAAATAAAAVAAAAARCRRRRVTTGRGALSGA